MATFWEDETAGYEACIAKLESENEVSRQKVEKLNGDLEQERSTATTAKETARREKAEKTAVNVSTVYEVTQILLTSRRWRIRSRARSSAISKQDSRLHRRSPRLPKKAMTLLTREPRNSTRKIVTSANRTRSSRTPSSSSVLPLSKPYGRRTPLSRSFRTRRQIKTKRSRSSTQ